MRGPQRLFPVTLEEQLACVEREIRLRERAYPRWVEARRMTETTAAREIAAMQAVAETLRRMRREELDLNAEIARLFGALQQIAGHHEDERAEAAARSGPNGTNQLAAYHERRRDFALAYVLGEATRRAGGLAS